VFDDVFSEGIHDNRKSGINPQNVNFPKRGVNDREYFRNYTIVRFVFIVCTKACFHSLIYAKSNRIDLPLFLNLFFFKQIKF